MAALHGLVGHLRRWVAPLRAGGPSDCQLLERFAADRGVQFELLRDPEFAFADELRIVAYPVTLFVDADGRILERTGPIDDGKLREEIAEQFGITA